MAQVRSNFLNEYIFINRFCDGRTAGSVSEFPIAISKLQFSRRLQSSIPGS
jgi:hypothetical protein